MGGTYVTSIERAEKGDGRAWGSAGLQLVIRNARITTNDQALHNIGIRNGLIVALTSRDEDLGPAEVTLDAAGRWVIPGASTPMLTSTSGPRSTSTCPGWGRTTTLLSRAKAHWPAGARPL